MSGLAKLDEKVASLEAAAEDIRAATREAHEAIQTLRLLKRDVGDLLARDARAVFDDLIGEVVHAGLANYAEVIRKAQDDAVARVAATFDELAAIFTGTERCDSEPSLFDLAEAKRRAREAGR